LPSELWPFSAKMDPHFPPCQVDHGELAALALQKAEAEGVAGLTNDMHQNIGRNMGVNSLLPGGERLHALSNSLALACCSALLEKLR